MLVLAQPDSALAAVTPPTCDLYVASLGDKAKAQAFRLAELVRTTSLNAECDLVGRSLKAQMKYADKVGAKFSLVLGDSELEEQKAKVKNMPPANRKRSLWGKALWTSLPRSISTRKAV